VDEPSTKPSERSNYIRKTNSSRSSIVHSYSLGSQISRNNRLKISSYVSAKTSLSGSGFWSEATTKSGSFMRSGRDLMGSFFVIMTGCDRIALEVK
jgi:hypothetical protein